MSPAEELAARYTAGVLRIRYPSLENLNASSEDLLCDLWKHDDPTPLAFYLEGIKDLAKLACHFELEQEANLLFNIMRERSN